MASATLPAPAATAPLAGSASTRLLGAVAAASVAAGAIHLGAFPEHVEEYWAAGLFFVVVAVGQLTLPLLLALRRGGPLVPLAGIVGNLMVVAVYVQSRTAGIPLGAGEAAGHAAHGVGGPEPVGLLDFTATGLELALLVMLVSLLSGRTRRVAVNGLLACGLLAWGLRLAALSGGAG